MTGPIQLFEFYVRRDFPLKVIIYWNIIHCFPRRSMSNFFLLPNHTFFAQFNCVLQNICGNVVLFYWVKKNGNTTKWYIMSESITKNKMENTNGWGSLGWMCTCKKKLHELNYIKMIKPNVPLQNR